MQAYFSHSYRDVPINTYFSELFAKAGISLRADQKTDVWCTAKLERYLFEMGGFVSIIPRRIAADESITYSPYIARELMLARRSRGPGILFVDGQLLTQYQSQFPPWAVPFFHEEPATEQVRHNKAIDRVPAHARTRKSPRRAQVPAAPRHRHRRQRSDAARRRESCRSHPAVRGLHGSGHLRDRHG